MAMAHCPRTSTRLSGSNSTTNLAATPVAQASGPPSSASSTLGDIVRTAHNKNKRNMRRRRGLHHVLQQSQFWRHLQHTFLTNPAESALFENMTVLEYENYCRARMADVHPKSPSNPSTKPALRRSSEDSHSQSPTETKSCQGGTCQRKRCSYAILIAIV
ncbi:uncharacterized protein MONBRDRAFT_11584 [Monosiga brevicollis MX1]|uniref:Uncharacterized protein n=1 Tax=Monosiga brevicollis TaxID=81824 RepID=A9V9P4_MONBE|nr:uncharacterized protein MONBRDRAFT_11584 [Monosiga brevicollis MX1]EDQ85756.1 predicted protein [Monosiga brevicollis MX1]|eukprot:XP_001749471.1 hypothetical protein [Monosiga brevicollis MX1]